MICTVVLNGNGGLCRFDYLTSNYSRIIAIRLTRTPPGFCGPRVSAAETAVTRARRPRSASSSLVSRAPHAPTRSPRRPRRRLRRRWRHAPRQTSRATVTTSTLGSSAAPLPTCLAWGNAAARVGRRTPPRPRTAAPSQARVSSHPTSPKPARAAATSPVVSAGPRARARRPAAVRGGADSARCAGPRWRQARLRFAASR